MNINCKVYNSLPPKATEIRQAVFMKEQGFEYEFDEIDNTAKHILLFVDDKAVAVGRFFTDDNESYHIGRLAVLKDYRKMGLGAEIMKGAEIEIKKLGGKRIELSAQLRAKGFYESLGYEAEGNVYFDEAVEHILMVKQL